MNFTINMQHNLFTVTNITPSTQSFDKKMVIYNTAQLILIEKEMKLEIKWTYNLKNINWEDLIELYRIAPLGIKDPEKLKTTFTNSLFKCFAYDGEKIIGVGRALADGADCSYICDIALHPEYQGPWVWKANCSKISRIVSWSQKNNSLCKSWERRVLLETGF